MTYRQWVRRQFASFPHWKVERARLAALARHHPDDTGALDRQRDFLALVRSVEFIKDSWQKGTLSHMEYVEIVGPLICPDAIAREGVWHASR